MHNNVTGASILMLDLEEKRSCAVVVSDIHVGLTFSLIWHRKGRRQQWLGVSGSGIVGVCVEGGGCR